MSKQAEVDIALGILDHQLVDSNGINCGKVDDLELTGLDTDSPEVVEILVGGNAWRTRGSGSETMASATLLMARYPGHERLMKR